MMMYSMPSSLISLPEYLPNRMRSPTLTSSATIVPSSSRLPFPTAITSPCCGFSWAESGMKMPLRVVSCSSIRFTTMRSYSGRIFIVQISNWIESVSNGGTAAPSTANGKIQGLSANAARGPGPSGTALSETISPSHA